MKNTQTVNELAIEERKAYFRKWRSENKEKVKLHNASYWKRRAAKKIQDQSQDCISESQV